MQRDRQHGTIPARKILDKLKKRAAVLGTRLHETTSLTAKVPNVRYSSHPRHVPHPLTHCLGHFIFSQTLHQCVVRLTVKNTLKLISNPEKVRELNRDRKHDKHQR